MCCRKSLSKHFMTTDVRLMGLQSLRHFDVDDFGTGMMVAVFRHGGMMACDSERLNILVRGPTRWSA